MRGEVFFEDFWNWERIKGICIVLKKVDSQTRVNNVQLTHRKAAQVLQ